MLRQRRLEYGYHEGTKELAQEIVDAGRLDLRDQTRIALERHEHTLIKARAAEVKKNGIILVDFAIVAERDHQLSPLEAIREACLLRLRPILMTTVATLLAAVPLAVGHGTGSELRRPLGYAMIGGLALSQLLTLYTTPVIYLHLDRFRVWLRRRRGPDVGRAGYVS